MECKRVVHKTKMKKVRNIPQTSSPSIGPIPKEKLLNALVSYYVNGNTQVSATELNLLPIPLGKSELDIARIAKKIQRTKTDTDRNKLTKELNKKVAGAYGLNASELEYIKKHLNYRLN